MIYINARLDESSDIRKLTLDSKSHWNYSEEYLSIWESELIMSPEYIKKNMVVVAEDEEKLVGYTSIIKNESKEMVEVESKPLKLYGEFFLDNLFVSSDYIGTGLGKELLEIAFEWCQKRGVKDLYVYSDPYATDFYLKMGASFLCRMQPNFVEQSLPLLVFSFK